MHAAKPTDFTRTLELIAKYRMGKKFRLSFCWGRRCNGDHQ